MIKTEGTISLDRIVDFPPMPYSFGLIDGNRTGTWRYVQPVYRDKLAPCSESCPAGNDIAKWMDLVSQGKEEQAYAISRAAHPFAATLGRVCPHPCGDRCNRAYLGGEIQIHAVEQLLPGVALADGGEQHQREDAHGSEAPDQQDFLFTRRQENQPADHRRHQPYRHEVNAHRQRAVARRRAYQ